jgi:hypothetical protein
MMKFLTRYWFEFDIEPDPPYPSWLRKGCGVTAYNYDDAVQLLNERIFTDLPMPDVRQVIEDVDISTLDTAHVLPNMDIPVGRGIWFPRGFR